MNGRKREIDICKGILTFTMILCHCIQFFGHEDRGVAMVLVNVINITTFSGFLFCFGYASDLAYYRKEWRTSAPRMAKNAIRILLAFYISGLAYMICVEDKIFRQDLIMEILLLKRYPGWSEFLASFAAVLAVGIVLFPVWKKMNGWIMAAVAAVSAAACFLPYGKVHNSWLALLIGSRDFITFPVVQYGVFFAAGIWMCRKEISWNLWIFLGTVLAVVPGVVQLAQTGNLPERFPPSVFYIAGGMIFVYSYYVLSCFLEKVREKKKWLEILTGYLEQIGKESLYYLLLSNIIIFALKGSSFSYRSETYAYVSFVVILTVIGYLRGLCGGKTICRRKM